MKIKVTSKAIAVGILSLIIGHANAANRSGKATNFPTFVPTSSPGPTASSAPSPFCDDGMNVEVKIKTDKYPGEITWTLQRNERGGVVEMSGGPYNENEELTWYRDEKCLPLGNYIFTIYDSFGNGLGEVDSIKFYGYQFKRWGEYEVNVDGVTTLSGGEEPFKVETGFIWRSSPPVSPPSPHNRVFFFDFICLFVLSCEHILLTPLSSTLQRLLFLLAILLPVLLLVLVPRPAKHQARLTRVEVVTLSRVSTSMDCLCRLSPFLCNFDVQWRILEVA
jgi:hypothetical protein